MKTQDPVRLARISCALFILTLVGGVAGRPASAQCANVPPIHWWPGEDNVNDIAGSSNGTLMGASYVDGQVGRAFHMESASEQWVELGTAGNFGTGDYSVELWVMFLGQFAQEQILIEKYVQRFQAPPSHGWFLAVQNFTPPRLTWGNLSANGFVHPSANVEAVVDTWHHVALTREGMTYRIYFDGTLRHTTTIGSMINVDSASPLKIGHRGHPDDTPGSEDLRGFYLNGMIDEPALYDRALSAAEVLAIFNAGSDGKCQPGCVTAVDIDPPTGTELGDREVIITATAGCGFTDLADTTVLIGGAAATLLEVTNSTIRLRTPPGTQGSADVEVIDSNGRVEFPDAYSYVADFLGARQGNVGASLGFAEQVLTINDVVNEPTFVVEVPMGQQIRLDLNAPSSRMSSNYALYAFMGENTGAVRLGFDLGDMVFAPPFAQGPGTILATFNLLGHVPLLGASTFNSQPAPDEIFNLPDGLSNPICVSFQALIRDDAARIPEGVSVSNAIVLKVQ